MRRKPRFRKWKGEKRKRWKRRGRWTNLGMLELRHLPWPWTSLHCWLNWELTLRNGRFNLWYVYQKSYWFLWEGNRIHMSCLALSWPGFLGILWIISKIVWPEWRYYDQALIFIFYQHACVPVGSSAKNRFHGLIYNTVFQWRPLEVLPQVITSMRQIIAET